MTGLPDIPSRAARDTKRLYFLDNLRIALTLLVIAHHVGQAYGPTGGAWPIQEAARAGILGPFFTVNRSFFMSFFFLISGHLMVMSYERSSPLVFIKSRLLRLGIPLVAFFFLVIPLQQYLCHWYTGACGTMSFGQYYVGAYLGHGQPPADWKSRWPEMNFGHLWYAYIMGLREVLPISRTAMGVVYPIWEALLCCGVCIGLLVLFRDKLNYQTRWTKPLAEGQYGAYLFHVPVIVPLQFALLGLALSPFTKFLLVTALGVPLTFLMISWIRRLALLRKIL